MSDRFSPYKSPSKGQRAPAQNPLEQADTPVTNVLILKVGDEAPIRYTWVGPPKDAKDRVAKTMSTFMFEEKKHLILLEQRKAQSSKIVADYLMSKIEEQEQELRILREEKAKKELQGVDMDAFFDDPEGIISISGIFFSYWLNFPNPVDESTTKDAEEGTSLKKATTIPAEVDPPAKDPSAKASEGMVSSCHTYFYSD
jgi:hypothetical protein